MTTAFPATDLPRTDDLGAGPAPLDSIGTYATYAEAQAAVDLLSDKGFEVGSTRIVGHDLTTVETVVRRETNGRAALAGAGSGALFGLMVALLIGILTIGPIWIGLLVTGVLFGAGFGALSGFLTHWATRGTRDFSSVQSLRAARYEVLVPSDRAGEAQRLLQEGRLSTH